MKLKILITCLGLSILTLLVKCSSENTQGEFVTTESGLKYNVMEDGSGEKAVVGDLVSILETTTYRDGTVIFSTDDFGGPLKFLVGGDQVIEGVDEGVRGMQVGEKRSLIVPPSLSKRKEYPPSISPDSILLYEIELVKIEPNSDE